MTRDRWWQCQLLNRDRALRGPIHVGQRRSVGRFSIPSIDRRNNKKKCKNLKTIKHNEDE